MKLAFVDLETTGLDPEVHEPWEVALKTFVLDPEAGTLDRRDTYTAFPVHSLATASSDALRLTSYYDRVRRDDTVFTATEEVAHEVAVRTAGHHLVGAVPSFDAAFLNRMLRDNGLAPAWHYHLMDVEAIAVGATGWRGPWKSDDLSKRLGVDPERFPRHTAMGDVDWAVAMFAAALSLRWVS